MKHFDTLRRNVATVNMDECETALYKATTNDKLPPKEKHVLTLVIEDHSESPTPLVAYT